MCYKKYQLLLAIKQALKRSLRPAHTDRFFVVDKKSEWKSFRVRWLLLRYKIAPIFSRSCLRQKIGPCALTSVREKIGVTSSNNGTSPIIVTHNSSDKKSVRARWLWSEKKSVRFFLGAACDKKSVVCADSVREKIGPSIRLFLGAPYDKKIGPCALGITNFYFCPLLLSFFFSLAWNYLNWWHVRADKIL